MHQHTIRFEMPERTMRTLESGSMRLTDAEIALVDELEATAHVAVESEREVRGQGRNSHTVFVSVVRSMDQARIDAVRAFCEAHGWTVLGVEA